MVIVMPDKHEAWTSQNDQHRFHEYMTNDVIPQINRNIKFERFQRSSNRGLSIGAHWAYKLLVTILSICFCESFVMSNF